MLLKRVHSMKNLYPSSFVTLLTFLSMTLVISTSVNGQNRIDTQRPDAPKLAAYGKHKVGVRTLELVNPNQIDVVNIDTTDPDSPVIPRYDRPLSVELWYPAADDANGGKIQTTYLRDGRTPLGEPAGVCQAPCRNTGSRTCRDRWH